LSVQVRTLIFRCAVFLQAFKKSINEKLASHSDFACDLHKAISELLHETETELLNDNDVNSDFSGCTLVLSVIRKYHVAVANVGDSRVSVVTRKGKGVYICTSITEDHKPELPSEKARILEAGGRVFPVKYPDGHIGPERVWLKDVDAPGLCMTRSLGDRVVHTVGVISTPEFFEYDLCPRTDCALIVATDGLWSVTPDKDAAAQCMSVREPSSAVGMMLRESHKRWVTAGDSIDDTTICVAYLDAR